MEKVIYRSMTPEDSYKELLNLPKEISAHLRDKVVSGRPITALLCVDLTKLSHQYCGLYSMSNIDLLDSITDQELNNDHIICQLLRRLAITLAYGDRESIVELREFIGQLAANIVETVVEPIIEQMEQMEDKS